MTADPEVRDLLARSLGWSEAHVSFDDAVRDLPVHLRGARPAGLPHSPWELLEHIRIAQRDIPQLLAHRAVRQPGMAVRLLAAVARTTDPGGLGAERRGRPRGSR